MDWQREELARETLERADLGAPVDAEILAARLGLRVYDAPDDCGGALVGNKILISPQIRHERWQFGVAHEIGHWLQREAGIRDSEWGANYLAGALLMPRDAFERSLRAHGWDLLRLRAAYRTASFEALARRVVALREARAFIFDRPQGALSRPRWYSVPYGKRPSEEELLAAREAVRTGAPVEVCAGLTGWPVLQADWSRAITLASL